MIKNLTCIECPRGCSLTIDTDSLDVNGNTCPKGRTYAVNEVTAPKRTVTSTVRVFGGGMLPVKTDKAVDKGKIFEIMDKINHATLFTKVQIGDIIINNVDGDGANVVAAKNI